MCHNLNCLYISVNGFSETNVVSIYLTLGVKLFDRVSSFINVKTVQKRCPNWK